MGLTVFDADMEPPDDSAALINARFRTTVKILLVNTAVVWSVGSLPGFR